MDDDIVNKGRLDAPDVRGAFERASEPPIEREAEKPKAELKPPGPAPAGMGEGAAPQVSPQLRKGTAGREFKHRRLLAREFRRAARDGFER